MSRLVRRERNALLSSGINRLLATFNVIHYTLPKRAFKKHVLIDYYLSAIYLTGQALHVPFILPTDH